MSCQYFTIWKKYIDFWMPRESIRSMNHKFIGTLNLVFDILLYFEFDYLVFPVYFRKARFDRLSYFFRKYIHHGVTRLPCCSHFKAKWYKSFDTIFINHFMHSMSHRLWHLRIVHTVWSCNNITLEDVCSSG